MKVLAIDPGERVGWATAEVNDHDELVLIDHGISGLRDFALKLVDVITDYDVVIFETYRISPAKVREHIGSDVPTLQLIGMIRLLAWQNPHVKLVKQPPKDMATARRTLNHPGIELALKKLPKAHDDSHDGSALLHLWKWYWKEYV